jgi:glycosyltransferase involved in cell wall biosynthesis
MPNDSIRLSIAIPTFNRSAFLRECLTSIHMSLSAVPAESQCEVVVSDNASTDDTYSVVQEFESTLPIRYCRQPINVGAHANFRIVASLASGDYIWILGDDDKITQNALGQVLCGLDSGVGAVICNVAVYDRHFSRIIRSPLLDITENIVFNDPNHMMARMGIHVGYISAVILNRMAFLAVPMADYRRFDRGGSCFMYAAYQVLHSCGPVLFLADPVVLNRGEAGERDSAEESNVVSRSDQWWNETFAGGFPQALAALHTCGYSSRAIRAAYANTMLSYVLPRLLFLKNARLPVAGLVREAGRNMAASWTVWLLLVPLSLVPGKMMRCLSPTKRKLSTWLAKGAQT